MDTNYFLFSVVLAGGSYLVFGSFIHVPNEPNVAAGWAYEYDEKMGITAMRNNFRVSPNDTCHVFKLTDQQRHDIHTISGDIKIEVMMYEAIRTQHGEIMTASELNATSHRMWYFCKKLHNFMKYNFYT